MSHLYIVKRGACRLIKEIGCPQGIPSGNSVTAERCFGRKTCFVEAERLECGGFFGENGFLNAKQGKQRRDIAGKNMQAYLASMVADGTTEILAVRLTDFFTFLRPQ